MRVFERYDQKWILVVDEGVELEFDTEGEAWAMSREQDYITAVRTANRQIWEGINALKALQREWNALDYSANLEDGEGPNAGITKAHVGAVAFDTADALETLLGQGHATNMARLL